MQHLRRKNVVYDFCPSVITRKYILRQIYLIIVYLKQHIANLYSTLQLTRERPLESYTGVFVESCQPLLEIIISTSSVTVFCIETLLEQQILVQTFEYCRSSWFHNTFSFTQWLVIIYQRFDVPKVCVFSQFLKGRATASYDLGILLSIFGNSSLVIPMLLRTSWQIVMLLSEQRYLAFLMVLFFVIIIV